MMAMMIPALEVIGTLINEFRSFFVVVLRVSTEEKDLRVAWSASEALFVALLSCFCCHP